MYSTSIPHGCRIFNTVFSRHFIYFTRFNSHKRIRNGSVNIFTFRALLPTTSWTSRTQKLYGRTAVWSSCDICFISLSKWSKTLSIIYVSFNSTLYKNSEQMSDRLFPSFYLCIWFSRLFSIAFGVHSIELRFIPLVDLGKTTRKCWIGEYLECWIIYRGDGVLSKQNPVK